MFLSAPKRPVQLGGLVTETAHGVTGVASLILLADMRDQRLRALHFGFERGDQQPVASYRQCLGEAQLAGLSSPRKTSSSDEVGNRPEGNRPRGYGF